MKVLMFGWEFPPYISGGLGTACHGLTRGLVDQGAEVVFVVPRLHEAASGQHVRLIGANRVTVPNRTRRGFFQVTESGSRFKEIAVDSPLQPYQSPETLQQRHQLSEHWSRILTQEESLIEAEGDAGLLELSGDYDHDLMDEVARYSVVGGRLGKIEPHDLIHAHDWMTYPAAMEARRASGKPLIVHVHATEFDRSGEHVNQAIYDLERAGMHQADLVVTVSERTRQTVLHRYGVDPAKTRVVHNAVAKEKLVDRDSTPRHLKEKIVLFLGRVTMQKGPDYFIEAAGRVLKKIKNVRFVMAGSGDMLPRMIERAAALRITDRFHFTGFLKGADVDRMFASCDLYVLPSVSEPFGITPFEAIKHDVPVIISKQSGVSELLPNAIKVDFWDVEQLSDSIVELLSQKEKTEQLVAQHRQDLAEVDWSRSAERLLAVYEEATDS